jgi:acyl-coenzyme A synthetase/AMP-(fatty) acid ligase
MRASAEPAMSERVGPSSLASLMANVAARGTLAWRDGVALDAAAFVARAAAFRDALGAAPGERWALFCEDTFEFAAALFGAWHAGKTVILPGDAQPDTLARLRLVADGFIGDLPDALKPSTGPLAADWTLPLPASTALVVHTSGTSGEPLAIRKSLAQLDAEVHALERRFGALCDTGLAPVNQDADDGADPALYGEAATAGEPVRVWATVSHQHIYGLLFRVLWPLAAGRAFDARRLEWPEQIARAIDGAAVLVSSPAHLARLPDTLDWTQARAALRAVFSSGGPLSEDAAGHAHGLLGTAPVEVYGSSETGGVAWRQRARHGDTWQALPGVAFRIADGLLEVRSPHLPDAQWWRTADRALAAGDGMDGFELLGRSDRLVKIGEKRVSLTAMEDRLCAMAEVARARVWMLEGAPGEAPADRPVVVAELTAAGRATLHARGKRALVDELRESLLACVERLALPRRWRFVDAMPVNAQGKTPLVALAALFSPVRPAVSWHVVAPAHATARVTVDAGLGVFDGHFPGRPVLPGVAQVDWALSWGRERFGVEAPFQRLEQLKFHRPVGAGAVLDVELHWDASAGTLRFELRSPSGVHSSGRAVFAHAGAAA